MQKRMVWFALAATVGGCSLAGTSSDIRGVEVGLASGVMLGQSATIALDAVAGTGELRCVSAVTECADYPCAAEVTIEYGPGCPLPLGGVAVGVVTVTGEWSSENDATLDFTFTDVRVGERGAVLASATTIRARRSGDVVIAEYTGAQASARGAAALAATSVWDVEVNTSGTPGDPSDDSYVIDGSNTAAGGISVDIVRIDEALITPDCGLNPVAGEASITESGVLDVRVDDILFHATCDGMAELDSALGGSRTIELDFLE